MSSFPRAGTAVTAVPLASRQPIWPHEKELFSSLGRQAGIYEAVPDKSKVYSKDTRKPI